MGIRTPESVIELSARVAGVNSTYLYDPSIVSRTKLSGWHVREREMSCYCDGRLKRASLWISNLGMCYICNEHVELVS